MSRRRGEFEHRTSIFEGAFRAWSHVGGLEPVDLENKSLEELDPTINEIENDSRLLNINIKKNSIKSEENGGNNEPKETADSENDEDEEISENNGRRKYPYEPLPRSGLAHPFVQAVLSPWLGADAEQDAIQLGLTTLRTWWQHRRKGESGSAIVALSREKMIGVVDGYTRHFFNLALGMVMKDGDQPPRTLHGKLKELEKLKTKRVKKRVQEEEAGKLTALALNAGLNHGVDTAPRLNESVLPNDVNPILIKNDSNSGSSLPTNLLNGMKQHDPTKQNYLSKFANEVSCHTNQLVHCGSMAPLTALSKVSTTFNAISSTPQIEPSEDSNYGNPDTTPVALLTGSGDVLIMMRVEGITCSHCVKIIETVLKGVDGTKSPIAGLLDAVADKHLKRIIIRIDLVSNAKRIAYESSRNLSMVGYTVVAKQSNIKQLCGRTPKDDVKIDIGMLNTAFEIVGSSDPINIFDWNIPCHCSPLGVEKNSCPRHNQITYKISDIFDKRADQVAVFLANFRLNSTTDGNGISTIRSSTEDRDIFHGSRGLGLSQTQLATPETTFGGGLSGLSSLNIDWEKMEDFDVAIDHSAHLNNSDLTITNNTRKIIDSDGIMTGCAMSRGGFCDCGPTCACIGCPIHDKQKKGTD